MRPKGFGAMDNIWMGSDFDVTFAQDGKLPASEVFPINCDGSDAELATLPCACGTAENMLRQARLGPAEHVLVAGASGGVGSAEAQLAKLRGARVTAVASASKLKTVQTFEADRVIDRSKDLIALLAKGYPLANIVEAQPVFLKTTHVGNVVLLPDAVTST